MSQMNNDNDSNINSNIVEITGETVEEAIATGLRQLNATPYEVIVEVLDEPSAGLFGLGARPARVRLERIGRSGATGSDPISTTSISAPVVEEATPIALPDYRTDPDEADDFGDDIPRNPMRDPERERSDRGNWNAGARGSSGRSERGDRNRGGEGRRDRGGNRGGQGDYRPPQRSAPEPEEPRGFQAEVGGEKLLTFFDVEADDEAEAKSFLADSVDVPEEEQDDEAATARIVLNEILERLNLRVRIVVRRSNPDEKDGSTPWIMDIAAQDESRLVGRRGESLASLQYIARLITSREMQKRATFIVDVNGYKAKRARTLNSLALRMADEAINRQRTVTLEPMPPHERRIVHMALRARDDVFTRSVGEGDTRKVTIVPREAENS